MQLLGTTTLSMKNERRESVPIAPVFLFHMFCSLSQYLQYISLHFKTAGNYSDVISNRPPEEAKHVQERKPGMQYTHANNENESAEEPLEWLTCMPQDWLQHNRPNPQVNTAF